MTQSIKSVFDRIIAVECKHSSGRVDNGTAFWAKVNGVVKLITASHIPWRQLPPPPVKVISGDTFDVSWSMTGGGAGQGAARIYAHSQAPHIDYAWLEFDDPSLAPPGVNTPFPINVTPPAVDDPVVATGFPGLFVTPHPTPRYAIGLVHAVQPSPCIILVAGSACGGYSGGPAFNYIGEYTLGDEVVGLMSGAPDLRTQVDQANLYILLGAKEFV